MSRSHTSSAAITSIASAEAAGSQSASSERIVQALDEYTALCRGGGKPNRSEFLARYADIVGPLAECLDSLEFVEQIAPLWRAESGVADSVGSRVPPGELGDFRILREIGRGGMGVVYEAIQISLERRVAIKVLPLAATLGETQLKRFKNEARAAAVLDHPHIVSVYSVGCERGIHYYAMRLIEGPSLADLLQALTALTPLSSPNRVTSPSCPQRQADVETAVVAALSTQWSTDVQQGFRHIATLGRQVAQGLQHAHELGVIHRDIKPANLLVDAAGRVYISDFGLARISAEPGVTMSGDLVGTLRYMSPEQIGGGSLVVDRRTDIYSLGITLYELCARQPAFPDDDRQLLMRRILHEQPPALRQVNPGIPRDLETIISKAIEKDPIDRYATAAQLADDLERFLEAKPLAARRPSWLDITRKWTRRHTGLVLAVTCTSLLLTGILATAAALVWREKQRTAVALQGEQRQRQLAEDNVTLGLDALEQVYLRLFEVELPRKGSIDPEDYALLTKLSQFYQRFAARNEDLPGMAPKVGLAYYRLATAAVGLGDFQTAEGAYDRAQQVLHQAVTDLPDDVDTRLLLVGTINDASVLYGQLKQPDKEAAAVRAAAAQMHELIRLRPDDVRYQAGYVTVLGNTCRMDPDQPELVGDVEKALEIIRSIATEHADLQFWDANLAETYCNLVNFLIRHGRINEADQYFRTGLQLAEQSKYADEAVVAVISREFASFLGTQRRPQDARTYLQRALQIRRTLAEQRPSDAVNLEALVDVTDASAILMDALGDSSAAHNLRAEAAQ